MKATFTACFGRPRPRVQDPRTVPLILKMLLMLTISIVTLIIATDSSVLFLTDAPAVTVQALELYAQLDRIMTIFCWAAFIISLAVAIVIAGLLFTKRKSLIRALPQGHNPVHETTVTINANGIRFTFEEPFTIAKTPWSNAITTATYLCEAPQDALQSASLKAPWYMKGYHLLILCGHFRLERTVNNIPQSLGFLQFRKKLGSGPEKLYLWIPDPQAASVAKAIHKYAPARYDRQLTLD